MISRIKLSGLYELIANSNIDCVSRAFQGESIANQVKRHYNNTEQSDLETAPSDMIDFLQNFTDYKFDKSQLLIKKVRDDKKYLAKENPKLTILAMSSVSVSLLSSVQAVNCFNMGDYGTAALFEILGLIPMVGTVCYARYGHNRSDNSYQEYKELLRVAETADNHISKLRLFIQDIQS